MSAVPHPMAELPQPGFQSRLNPGRVAMLVWLFILASFVSVREREAAQLMSSDAFDTQVKLQILAWFLLGLLSVYLWVRGRTETKLLVAAPLCWYGIYILYAVFSASFSLSPPLTVFRSGQLLVTILLIVALRDRLDRVYMFIFVFLVINWIMVLMANSGFNLGQTWLNGPDNMFLLFNRHTPEPWRFASPIAHASQVSIVGAAGAVGLAMRTSKKSLSDNLPCIIFFAITVLVTVSRTAIAAMLAGFLVVLLVRKQGLVLILTVGILMPIALVFTPLGEKVVKFGMRGQSAEEFQSLTGRSDIYRMGLERAVNSLPTGEGFVAGRAKAIVSKSKGRAIVHSHNLFIESAVAMGVVGVFLAAMILLALARSVILAVIHIKPDETGISPGWEMLVMSIPCGAFCIMDRGFASPVCPFSCLFIIVLANTARLLQNHHFQPDDAELAEAN